MSVCTETSIFKNSINEKANKKIYIKKLHKIYRINKRRKNYILRIKTKLEGMIILKTAKEKKICDMFPTSREIY